MKPPKAIEILNEDLTYTYLAKFTDLQDAIQLGKEALQCIQVLRIIPDKRLNLDLPSEDKDTSNPDARADLSQIKESPLGREPEKLSECPFEHLRDYPGCYEDCPDVEECPHSKKVKV